MLGGDKDLEEYRKLMEPPGTYEEGFSWTALVGAMFIGFLMVPGSIYMGLLAGIGVGPAAQWVTVILFIEIAKRAHKSMKRAEIFILFYMAGAVMSVPFEGLVWNQFFVQSQAVAGQGMREMIPVWFAPSDPAVLAERNFLQLAWLPAIGLILFKTIVSQIDNNVLSYGLFKLASDREKLPFPMAPIGAQGIMALAEDLEDVDDKKITSWRWRAFAIGGAIGLVFGFIYMGIPTLSPALLGKKLQILPIPFSDWTGRTEKLLPAVATGLSYNLGAFIIGMVVPFWAIVGAFFGLVVTCIMNPVLYHFNMLPSWQSGDSTVETLFKNTVDFYFSFGLGISLAVAVIGFSAVFAGVRKLRQHKEAGGVVEVPKDRGDIPNWIVVTTYLATTACYLAVSGYLIGWHTGVMTVLVVYGFFYTPIISYVTARLEGVAGQALSIPFVREAGMILSGYNGVACWFLPFPLHNYGVATVFYRQAELTGTKFTSIWKTVLTVVPFIILCSIFFAQFIWAMGPIPSSNYPFADALWELQAKNQTLLYSATTGGYSQFMEAFKPWLILIGLAAGLGLFAVLKWLAAPTMLLYGAVRGLNQTTPHTLVIEFGGALLARFYLEKKMGLKWRQYAPVVSAGFFCGAGLITMFCIGITFLSKSVFKLPF
jgi:hypothetical protein